MLEAFAWWLTLQALGITAFPVAAVVFRPLADRGYAMCKALGLLLTGWIAFSLSMLGLPFGRPLFVACVLLLAICSTWLLMREHGGLLAELRALFATRAFARHVVGAELLFAVAFVSWTILRAYAPDIWGTEKFMDYGFLNSVLRSGSFPPKDMWLAGYGINYYYFGYVLMAELTSLSGVRPAVAFPLANVALFSLTALGTFGFTYNLIKGHLTPRNSRPALGRLPRLLSPYLFAVLAALLVVAMGNLTTLFSVKGPDIVSGSDGWRFCFLCQAPQNFDWWAPSRVIRDFRMVEDPGGVGRQVLSSNETINEFPAFSFFLGDLHPHVMSLPLVLLAAAAAYALSRRQPRGSPEVVQGPSRPGARPTVVVAGVVAGSLYAANTWDYPTYLLVLLAGLALAHRAYPSTPARWRVWLKESAVLVATSVLAFLPFILTFQSPAGAQSSQIPGSLAGTTGGLIIERLSRFLLLNTADKTIVGFLVIFGIFLVVLVGWLVYECAIYLFGSHGEGAVVSKPLFVRVLALVTLASLALAVVLRFPLLGLLAPLITASVLLIIVRPVPVERNLALVIFAIGASIALIIEVVYLRDAFNDRMNTLFKFYFQIWLLWGLVSAYAAWRLVSAALSWNPLDGRASTAWPLRAFAGAVTVVFALLALSGLPYLPLAQSRQAHDRTQDPHFQLSLDGTRFLQTTSPGDLQAIQWLDQVGKATDVVLECCRDEYTTHAGRISAFTGIPTVLAWDGHESQWRGGQSDWASQLALRRRLIDDIYQGADPASGQPNTLTGPGLLALLHRYGVTYVVDGETEKGLSGAAGQYPGERITPYTEGLFARTLAQAFKSSNDRTIIYRVPR